MRLPNICDCFTTRLDQQKHSSSRKADKYQRGYYISSGANSGVDPTGVVDPVSVDPAGADPVGAGPVGAGSAGAGSAGAGSAGAGSAGADFVDVEPVLDVDVELQDHLLVAQALLASPQEFADEERDLGYFVHLQQGFLEPLGHCRVHHQKLGV